MTNQYEEKVEIFKNCINETDDMRSAILMAHEEHGLNAADADGGITSDQAAWQDAAGIN